MLKYETRCKFLIRSAITDGRNKAFRDFKSVEPVGSQNDTLFWRAWNTSWWCLLVKTVKKSAQTWIICVISLNCMACFVYFMDSLVNQTKQEIFNYNPFYYTNVSIKIYTSDAWSPSSKLLQFRNVSKQFWHNEALFTEIMWL